MEDLRVDKLTANYDLEGNDARACSGCVYFIPPDECGKVEGVIAPQAVCDLFQPKPDLERIESDIFLGDTQ